MDQNPDIAQVVDCSNCGNPFWYDRKNSFPGWADLCDLCNDDAFQEEEIGS